MWSTEHSIETTAAPETIWRLWADVAGWPAWNAEPIELRIAEAVEPERFVDQAHFGGVVVRTTHRAERLDGDRVRVVYRMEITGPESDTLGPQIGPEITADFPQVLAALVDRAEA